jgi:hypothetical protein
LGSSVIKHSLRSTLTLCFAHVLPTTLSLAVSSSLSAQAPDTSSAQLDPLPRFTLHEIVTGRNDSLARIPGPWLRAAATEVPESLPAQTYSALAAQIGLTPLQGSVLASERSQHVMGLFRRTELVEVCRRTLVSIRAAIPSDTTRARFDRIFYPQGVWVVDLHDAAFNWVRTRVPNFTAHAAWRSLAATHWVDPADSLAIEALPRALYGLAVLAATDSAGFAVARRSLWRADSTSAATVFALLQGYSEAERWYSDALGFLLGQPWLPDDSGTSVRDLVRDAWRKTSPGSLEIASPDIEPHWFGYPQAVPHYSVPPRLFVHLVRLENRQAVAWLERQGQAGLLRSLRRLPPGDSNLVLLQTRSETLRVSTVTRQAQENLNGFLEPHDAIAIDPGYSPLLALGAVVHEWQHLLFRRRQLDSFAGRLARQRSSVIGLPGIEPHIAEGFAEWSTERMLAPLVRRWPLLGLGELEKRAGLARSQSDDQHALGYALVRALAAALPEPMRTTELLLRHADAPARILTEPVLRRAWSRYRGSADLAPSPSPLRMLLPEITFTIEDGLPDVVSTRILVPNPRDATR